MKVLVSWLRELVDVPVPIAELARDLHMAGFEVASVEPPPGARDALDDAVIDFEITANRPDCLSLIGLAREVAARYDTPLRSPELADLGAPADALPGLSVTIEDATRCPRYCAALADVTLGASPGWLAARLAAAGVRAISSVVDVTNYVLLELGHPLHAFDVERLGGQALRVRLPTAGERLTTLDGQARTLEPDMLVIADATRAQALAGIMGGADSEVSAETTTIALESAWFLPASVRRTGRRLGLSTEASYRFERGADIGAPPVALARVGALLAKIGAGTIRPGWIDAYPSRRAAFTVDLAAARVRQVLGVDVPPAEIERILRALGFDPSPVSGGWRVGVPSWRVDVARDVDLVEEIARHHGYDRLPTTFPALAVAPPAPDPRLARDRQARRLAAAAGFSECVTFSFIERRAAQAYAPEEEIVGIANPLSETFAVLRPSLLPGLVASLGHNRRHGQRDVRLFELGSVFTKTAGEGRAVSLAWIGAAAAEHWSGSGRAADVFDLKGAVETLADALGVTLAFETATAPFLVPGRAARAMAVRPDGSAVPFGLLGQLAPALAAAHDVPARDEVFVAELALDEVAAFARFAADPRVASLPRFPTVVRDLSIVVADTLPAAVVRGTIRASAPPWLARVQEFDRYQGAGVPEGRVSLSYRLTFQAPDRTLTDAEVEQAMDGILAALAGAHGAVRR